MKQQLWTEEANLDSEEVVHSRDYDVDSRIIPRLGP